MTQAIIVLADHRPKLTVEAIEIERLRRYAQRYHDESGLAAFSDDELNDMERLIVRHSMLLTHGTVSTK